MKKGSLLAVIFGSILLAGCGTIAVPAQQTPTPEVNSGVTTSLSGQKFPLCEEEKLADVQVLQMESLVKNCTEKKEEGKFIDGLGGVYPEYDIMNKSIVIAAFDNDIPDTIIACQDTHGAKYISNDSTGVQ